jgi:hypothetical protein
MCVAYIFESDVNISWWFFRQQTAIQQTQHNEHKMETKIILNNQFHVPANDVSMQKGYF